MKNNFLNNNGVNLHNTKKNPKTKVESQIEMLKQQEQAIITELNSWETKNKKAERLTNYLDEVNQFSTKYLVEAVKKAKRGKKRWLENFWGKNYNSTKIFDLMILQKKLESENFQRIICEKNREIENFERKFFKR